MADYVNYLKWCASQSMSVYGGVECDQCGSYGYWNHDFSGDICCNECAYEDKTYRREVLGGQLPIPHQGRGQWQEVEG